MVGIFDTGTAPSLGWISNGAANTAFDGTAPWFTALQTFLSAQGLSDVAQTHRYCLREYASPVTSGALAATLRNLPPGVDHRAFVLAIRTGTTDVGHLLSPSATVSAGATASLDLGAFSTD